MQHNALCTQGTVGRIRNVHRAYWRGCPDLADRPSCFSLLAQRQTLGGLGGRGAAGSLAPSSLGQQRVRLPPTRSSSARPRRPPEERLGAAVGLGFAHPARAPRFSRPGGHSAEHAGHLGASVGTCRGPPSQQQLGPGSRRPRRARSSSGSGSGPAPPARPASRAISSRSPPGTRAAPCRRSRRHRRRAFLRRAAPGFQLRAGTGSVGGGAGGGQETEKRGRAGSREPEPQPGPELGRLLRRRLPPPPSPTAASRRHRRKLGDRGPRTLGVRVEGRSGRRSSSAPGPSGRLRAPPPPRRLSQAFCSQRRERRAELTVILTVISTRFCCCWLFVVWFCVVRVCGGFFPRGTFFFLNCCAFLFFFNTRERFFLIRSPPPPRLGASEYVL